MAGNLDFMNASLFLPIIGNLEQHGSPVERMLETAGLQVSAFSEPNSFVPRYAGGRFAEIAARYAGDASFSYTCVMEQKRIARGAISGLVLLPELSAIERLKTFIAQANKVTTTTAIWLEMGGENVWILRRDLRPMHRGTWQIELFAIALFERIISGIIGRKWLPRKLRICSNPENSEFPEAWYQTQITTGCEATAIAVPKGLLFTELEVDKTLGQVSRQAPDPFAHFEHNLVDNLGLLIMPYVHSKKAKIELVAEAFGMSLRSFQRRLTDFDLTYSKLLEEARFQTAIKSLHNSEINIEEIAHRIGYTHPENFTRAFRRRFGMSPSKYRRMLSPNG
jgi:AraC-like DNA-binding protein